MYSNELVCNILEYINENINAHISINDISNKTYFNRYYIMKRFKKELGISINDYINIKRIYNSTKEIRNLDDSFLNIALNNGFNSLEYFSETFKKIMGISPRDYKKSTYFIIKLEDNKLILLRQRLVEISTLLDKVNTYLSKRKPNKPMVKKLSIFK